MACISTTLRSSFPSFILPQELLAAAASPSPGLVAGAAANTLVYTAGIRILLAGLTWEGVFTSWVLGTLTYSAFGPGAYLIVCTYFLVGSLVSGRWSGAMRAFCSVMLLLFRGLYITTIQPSTFLILHWQVTKVKLEQKQREGIAEARSGRRSLVGGRLGLRPSKACKAVCTALPHHILGHLHWLQSAA